jgi:hypothetical protein
MVAQKKENFGRFHAAMGNRITLKITDLLG